jgi:1,4-alpha-glucan branching enzyme
MPFGAEARGELTRFRLWAPAARDVQLRLDAAGDAGGVPMEDAGDGWW